MTNSIETIAKRLKGLPQEIQEYINNDQWTTVIQTILTKHSLTAEQSEGVKFEVFLYLLAMQDEKELAQQIKDTLLTLPGPISTLITEEILETIPQEVRQRISEICNNIDKKIESIETPNMTPSAEHQKTSPSSESTLYNTPTEETPQQIPQTNESQAGVEVIPEEKEIEETTVLGKNSLINSIEHPEEAEKTEREAKTQPHTFNPITSKLGGSTGTEGTTPPSPHYGESDPYREPVN